MYTKSFRLKCSVILFVIIILCFCDCAKRNGHTKFKRKVNHWSDIKTNNLKTRNTTNVNEKRGFFGHGVFTLGKVLNFFPVGGERECRASGHHVARSGICLNPYDCRQRDGTPSGDCAHGLGVCCVFEVTCGGTVQNNLTYFSSPGFPELWSGEEDCKIEIEKTHAGIMQLKIDFIHFTIGQPNRRTGACDEDAMILGEGRSNFTLCGQNHKQHVYYTLSSAIETREDGELPSTRSTPLVFRMRGGDLPRLWLLRIAQMPLAYSAPHNCLQYLTESNGTIRSFNFASNGRHLANQQYRSCIRRNTGFCTIRYSPCDSRSFRIGPGGNGPEDLIADPVQNDDMMPVNDQIQEEGSGVEPQIVEPPTPAPGLMNRIWSYIWPSWIWGQSRTWHWSPYTQNYGDEVFPYYGYGNYGKGLSGYGRQKCGDRVTIPCENEYFVSSSVFSPGVCDPHHCGSNFCPGMRFEDCHVESSISPFAVSMHFGPPTVKENPEDNIGMCLRYKQIPCN
ncbi:uncharacterized protein LOC110993936 isoform X1 [Pieris rapae]|uniref:uncharacterized protein LOC110993936 isoform X1 n=1 Tax=Pieris rapae TaxID=64459 RepID=UPI001E280BAC|nr:uncharacterized protein LOC110993936 isoform X1 [Pieris rapae]